MVRFAGNAARVVAVRLRRRAVIVAWRCQIETHASLLGLNTDAIRTFNLTFRAGIVGDFRRLVRACLRSRIGRSCADLYKKSASRDSGQLCHRTHRNPLQNCLNFEATHLRERCTRTSPAIQRSLEGPECARMSPQSSRASRGQPPGIHCDFRASAAESRDSPATRVSPIRRAAAPFRLSRRSTCRLSQRPRH